MAQQKLNLYRLIIHVLLLTFSISISTVNAQAQHSNGTHDNQYEIYTNFNPTIALLIVVLVCAFFLLGVFSMFIRQCSEPDTSAAPSAVVVPNLSAATNSSGLDPAVIEKLFPIFFYSDVKTVKIGRETLECAICLSEFEDDETLRLLPKCNHVFHPDCIDEWLASHVTCPVCRRILAPESDEIPKFSPPEMTVPDLNQSLNEVAITVNEEPNSDSSASIIANRDRRSSISGRFPRSHSTGHSLVNIERYTLRLPEEMRTQIMANAKLKRTLSFNVITTKEWNVIRREYKIGGEGSSRGKQIGWSERWSILINSGVYSDSVNSRKLLTSVKLNCLSLKVEGVEQALPV